MKILLALAILILPHFALAQDPNTSAEVSPKQGWGDFDVVEQDTSIPFWQEVLLWPVNRVLDFIDVFRLDVGAGATYGGVVRLSKYGQMGYRVADPGSLRIGNFGRAAPFIIEDSSEKGFGPNFKESEDREVLTGEVGVGADLYLVGAYGGVCLEEVFDFAAGLVFLDPMDDDIR